jgi:aconitate hydratase
VSHNLFDSLKEFTFGPSGSGRYYALPALEAAGLGKVSRMPYSLRVVLESVLRNCDGKRITRA